MKTDIASSDVRDHVADDGLLDGRAHERIYIGGWVTGEAGHLSVYDAATGEELGRVGAASGADASSAVTAAAAAQPAWAALSFERRAEILYEVARILEVHREEIERQLIRESGSTRLKASREIHHSIADSRRAAALCSETYGSLAPVSDPNVLAMVRRVPVGVVAVITPWNAPLGLAFRSVAPALALGNAVVLKPDPNTPICGGIALMRAFEEAGLPPGVLGLVPGGRDVGVALCRHPAVRVVSFTGSTATGRAVAAECAATDKVPLLELGGNNVTIVLPDADVERAATCGARGTFAHAGQICMATGRHLVHESLVEQYLERLVKRASSMRVGNPIDPQVEVGPVINARQHAEIMRLVDESIAQGAVRLAGELPSDERFISPTVLGSVTPDMPCWRDEIFGPVAPVVSYSTEDEAVLLANDTQYGLVAGVHSADAGRALDLGRRLRVGVIQVNGPTVGDEAQISFGGTKASGNHARFGGDGNWEAYTEAQTLWVHGQRPVYGVGA